jgi:hypothetical protein
MGDMAQSQLTAMAGLAAMVAICAAVVAIVALAALHLASPEFSPAWRMVSEYANGQYRWLLSIMFAAWGIAALALALALMPLGGTTMGKVGLFFLILAGVGPFMAAFFDINHKLHGLSALIGIPSLPIAAVLLTILLNRSAGLGSVPMWAAHLTWISVILMAAGMGLLFWSLKRAGVDLSAQTGPMEVLPDGTIALVGYANRLLVVAHCGWIALAARAVLRAN